MSGRWTRRWASCARGRNRAQAKRRRRDRRMRARRLRCCGCAGASGAMLRMRGRVGEASAKALAGGKAARGRTARGEAAGLSGGRSLPYNDSSERRGILPHRTEKRKSMREGFRAGAFFLCAKGEGAGEGAGEAGGGVVVRICTNRENARMAAKRGDGEWMRTGGEPGERMGGEGVRKRRERRKAERGGGCAAARGGRN